MEMSEKRRMIPPSHMIPQICNVINLCVCAVGPCRRLSSIPLHVNQHLNLLQFHEKIVCYCYFCCCVCVCVLSSFFTHSFSVYLLVLVCTVNHLNGHIRSALRFIKHVFVCLRFILIHMQNIVRFV